MISRDLEEYRSFLKAIAGGDREARLAFADWLEERGLDDEAGEQRRLATDTEQSKEWIAHFASRVGLTYDDLMGGAEDWLDAGEYLCRGGLLEGEYVPDEFWDHYHKVTGVVVPNGRRGSFFTCAC